MSTSRVKEITRCLKKMGVSTGAQGFYYIRSAVDMSMEHFENHGGTPPEDDQGGISPHCGGVSNNRIEMTMLKGNAEYIHKVFGSSYSASKRKPTNTEFIATIADYLLTEGDEG